MRTEIAVVGTGRVVVSSAGEGNYRIVSSVGEGNYQIVSSAGEGNYRIVSSAGKGNDAAEYGKSLAFADTFRPLNFQCY